VPDHEPRIRLRRIADGTVKPEMIETERLVLRRPVLDDAPAIFEEYAADPRVARYMVWRPHTSVETVAQFLQSAIDGWTSGKLLAWVITLRGADRPLGMIDARLQGGKVEVGYVLARPYWSRGYMTEALRAVAAWALSQPDVFRVWATCDLDNAPSARVLEKAGFQYEGILRRWLVFPNVSPEPRDCRAYARTR
jgi:[ribosomal protein S5]-alanine N-acetyltransferase